MKGIEVDLFDVELPSSNTRAHNAKSITALANSIEQFDFNAPIIIDKTNVVVAGVGRALATRQLGMTAVILDRLRERDKLEFDLSGMGFDGFSEAANTSPSVTPKAEKRVLDIFCIHCGYEFKYTTQIHKQK